MSGLDRPRIVEEPRAAEVPASGACPEFELALIDSAIAGGDATTAEHVRSCDRCARVAAEYARAARAGKAALRARPHGSSPIGTLLAATILLAAAAILSRYAPARVEGRQLTVLPRDGAIVDRSDPLRARIRAGTSTFVLADPGSVVDTPFGSLRCPNGCEFTVVVEPDECGLAMPPGLVDSTPVKMSITVAAGQVASDLSGQAGILAQAHRLTLPFDHYR